MKPSGLNMGQVKKQNRFEILQYMNSVGPVSRKDIAEVTGLTAAAVTQISAELLEEGILRETGLDTKKKTPGRKKVFLEINYDYANVLSVNIEQQETLVALCNLKGDLLEQRTLPTGHDAKVLLHAIVEVIEEIRNQRVKDAQKIAGISVGGPGLVEKERGVSLKAFGIWEEEVEIAAFLEKALNYPVVLENNVNALGNAELLFDYGKTHDNLLLIKWGPGVGSSIIIDRKVYDGRNGKAAEIGHFIVEKNGRLCSCGRRGCLTTKISSAIIKEKGKDYYKEAIDLFARTVINSMTMLAPNRVILCGKMFHDESVQEDFIRNCMEYDSHYNQNRILVSNLLDKENYIGNVATFVLQHIF